jgi:uncharacterized membrane protein YkvA (DUF1232 family)
MTGNPVIDGIVVAVVAIAASWLILVAFLWLHRPSRELVGPALRLVPDLVRLVRALLSDPATPRSARVALVALLAYLLSPIDLVPDFLPGIGSLDDLIVVAVVLRWTGRRVGLERLRAGWSGDEAGFDLLRRLVGFGENAT